MKNRAAILLLLAALVVLALMVAHARDVAEATSKRQADVQEWNR